MSTELNDPADPTLRMCMAARAWIREQFRDAHMRVQNWEMQPMPEGWRTNGPR